MRPLLGIALTLSACASPEAQGLFRVESGALSLVLDLARGTFDISRGGALVVEGATADVLIRSGETDQPRSLDLRQLSERRVVDGRVVGARSDLELSWSATAHPDPDRFELTLEARNTGDLPVVILKLSPLVVDAEQGGRLHLGARPARHRILENGRFAVFDQTAELSRGDVEPFALAGALPIPLRGSSVSNWSHALVDLDDPRRNIVAGWLTAERALPTLGVAASGAFTTYAAECALLFHGKTAQPGQSVRSERLYFAPGVEDPLAALEAYASRIAEHGRFQSWANRGKVVPSGWNSWTGGSGTGGYGQRIDEAIIQANLRVAQRELVRFGLDTFPIDDGWQRETGDWSWDPAHFPGGAAAMVQAISAAGAIPGLWLAPFWVKAGSTQASLHPEWLTPREDGLVGSFGKDHESLDLSQPAVLQHLQELFSGLRQSGFGWVKADFTYWQLLGRPVHDPTLTNIEAFRQGWRALREALGPEVFLLGIGVVGANLGVVDGMRTTLDNGPRWDSAPGETGRSFKATVKSGTRRWFYQNRAFIRHDDLIFFRSWPDPEVPPLSLGESRAFASWIALGGGSVDLGDKLVDLAHQPEALDVIRRILPVDPQAARPLDVLERSYPEHFRRRVERSFERWTVEGLFNWGTNEDLRTEPATPLAEEPRRFTVEVAEPSLLFEFWSGRFLGRFEADTEIEVAPRSAQIIAVRRDRGVPQLLGTNRHILMGATDVSALGYDAASKVLSGELVAVRGSTTAPFTSELSFYVPAGATLLGAVVDGREQVPLVDGPVVKLRYQAALPSDDGRRVPFSLRFR